MCRAYRGEKGVEKEEKEEEEEELHPHLVSGQPGVSLVGVVRTVIRGLVTPAAMNTAL